VFEEDKDGNIFEEDKDGNMFEGGRKEFFA
jgi:hypothetical protein